MFGIRLLILALVAGIAVPALTTQQARAGETTMTCTNPASGARWQVKIDLEHGTVDANPARISDTQISWHDTRDGGNYTLDRSSGNLTVIVASSTGGYFLYDSCKPENSG